MSTAASTSQSTERFELDHCLLVVVLALASIGVVMVASASMAIAEKNGLHPFYYVFKHLIALGLGTTLALLCIRIPLANLERASAALLLLSIPLMLMVFLPGLGVTVNGSTRWIRTGLLNFQVVEAVKITTAIFLAGYLVRQNHALRETLFGTIKPLCVAALIAALLLAQPDFGGAVLILAMAFAMIWLGGARIRDLILIIILTVPAVVWMAVSESYRLRRIKSFLDPWADPFDSGFQLTQALIAIGSGDWWGAGLGGSVQKLFYLPEAHTDFILAVYAEEMGLAGILVLLILFAVLIGRGMVIAMRALRSGQYFSGYLAFGLSFLLGTQAMISVGVNFGLLPTKGLTLPLISSGGSSVMMTCVMLGLLFRISHESRVGATAAVLGKPRKPRKRKPAVRRKAGARA